MATFQMETRQPPKRQKQQQQQTNLKHRAAATSTSAETSTVSKTTRRQRRQLQRQCLTDPPATAAQSQSQSTSNETPPCNRLFPASPGSTPRLLNACSSSFYTAASTDYCSCQRALIMLTMLIVVIVVISGNGVFAAQRDSYKSKDMSNSNNAIPNSDASVMAAAAGAAVPNGVAGSGSMNSNTNSNNNNGHGISNVSNGNSKNGVATAGTGGAGAAVSATGNSMTTASAASGSGAAAPGTTTTITGIPSSSLQKVSSSSSNGAASLASGINRNSIELIEEARNSGPYFDRGASKNVTALLGKTAYLNCRVKNLGNKTMLLQVSWVRHRDIHLLTVGRYTYTSDQRFRAIHQPQTEDWMLQIKYPQHRDSGIYECQVSTTPHMSHYIHLNVVEPSTEIIGAPDLYIESGSTINLTCVILNSPEPPAYIFWNHNDAIINYDSPRGGVSVVTIKGETTTSFLLIKSARPSDSGHYQCNPSNAKPKSVMVHVLNGVSHSVSRGVPSSNAARGTSASSHVSKSLSLSVPVCVLVQLSVCQALYAVISGAMRCLAANSVTATTVNTSTSLSRHCRLRRRSGSGCDGNSSRSSTGYGYNAMRHFVECILNLLTLLRAIFCSASWSRRWRYTATISESQIGCQAEFQLQSVTTFRQVYEADIR